MAADDPTERLREAARHRGLKLVKSRRRKAGGDFGCFGLTDAGGKRLLGFGKDGLTASAEDITSYLQKGVAANWAESARTTPARVEKANAEQAPKVEPAAKSSKRTAQARVPQKRSPPKPTKLPEPTPLTVRKAKSGDAPDIAGLAALDATAIAAAMRGGVSLIVADRGGVIGCIAWHEIPTLHGEIIGRITTIVVAKDQRRQGIGTALIDGARAALEKRGCTLVEAMSDIEVRNVHGFYRALGFRQSGYRFIIG
ncbi:MAG: GNAT family N-acetyltransferase [Rhizorhabdus sp.]